MSAHPGIAEGNTRLSSAQYESLARRIRLFADHFEPRGPAVRLALGRVDQYAKRLRDVPAHRVRSLQMVLAMLSSRAGYASMQIAHEKEFSGMGLIPWRRDRFLQEVAEKRPARKSDADGVSAGDFTAFIIFQNRLDFHAGRPYRSLSELQIAYDSGLQRRRAGSREVVSGRSHLRLVYSRD